MKIKVKVITNSSQQKVEETADHEYRVYVHAKPIKGEANAKTREALCEYFNLPKHKVVMVSGKTSRLKVFRINDKLSTI
jgi:uncharacterized protein YggU (UPF0235/DUF167 family)